MLDYNKLTTFNEFQKFIDDWLKQILKPIKKEDDSRGEARHYQLASKASEKAGRDVKEFLKYYDRDLEDYLSGRRKEL